MYRDYEDVLTLEKALEDVKTEYADALHHGADMDALHDIHERMEDLKARVNYAWQDDEYNMDLPIN